MEKLTLREITDACGGEFVGETSLYESYITKIETDSRLLTSGSLFIPIVGENFDGQDFIGKAFEKGAVCTLSQNDIEDKPYIKVKSTFQALKDIAEYYRSLFDVKVVAITGSVGKTTAKEMIASVLSQKFNVHKSEKNYNNEIGVPLTLFGLKREHEVAVIEMGMNHFGEIQRLSKTARPDICVITNVDYTHIEYLGSREGIFKAKCEIFEFAKEGFTAYLNGDDDMLVTLKNRDFKKCFFGFDENNDIIAEDINPMGFGGTEFVAEYKGKKLKAHISKPGNHLIYSALAAAAIGMDLGIEKEQIINGISDFEPVGKRMEVIKTDRITILNDVYNAIAKSVKAAIDILGFADGRKICVLGDMGELGDYAPKLHKQVGEYAAKSGVDVLFCAGELSKNTAEAAKQCGIDTFWYETQDMLIKEIKDKIKTGDTVLVKASRGQHFENTVEALKTL